MKNAFINDDGNNHLGDNNCDYKESSNERQAFGLGLEVGR
jgi:hypothetical protein